MFLEIELKLSIDPAHVDLLYQHPLLMQAKNRPISELLISRYFDTADLRLRNQGLSLRLREAEGRMIQTLKTAGQQIGELHHRHEWEQPIQSTLPNIQAFSDEIAKKLATIIGTQPLVELFHTSFTRTSWDLYTEDGSQIELVLDQGVVKTETQEASLHEIELELKQGDKNRLSHLATALKQTIPLSLETRSKAERGYLLYTKNLPALNLVN
jgi:triphosphatase